MQDDLVGFGGRLREADTFGAVAALVIEEVGGWPGVTGVAVEAHDEAGPSLWLGDRGCDALAARRYLDGGFARDPLLARARRGLGLVHEGPSWLAPLVGCGELVGVIRIAAGAAAEVEPALGPVAAQVSVRLAQLGSAGRDAEALTARQYEVAVLVARGATNPEIARLLAISPDAVKKHVSRALEALAVSNRTELAAIAGRWRCAQAPVLDPSIQVVRRADAWRNRGLRAA